MSKKSNKLARKLLTSAQVEEAALRLKKGEIGIIPTETFWGISTNPYLTKAVLRLFDLKKREYSKSVPLICAGLEQVKKIVNLPPKLEILVKKFWPGPLSLLLKTEENFVSPQVKNKRGEICVRVSSHNLARRLSELAEIPIIATSANLSGEPPVTKWSDLPFQLLQEVDFILDSEEFPRGEKPSTILKITEENIVVIREGVIAFKTLFFEWQSIKI